MNISMCNQKVLLMLCLAYIWAGCDDATLDPFDNDARYFTVYGYLDVLERDHEVRVIPVTRQSSVIESPTALNASIDAVVTSTDVRTGETRTWSYALERLEDGTYGHIFRSSFIVIPGRTYRLDITRSDGVVTSAETKVPYIGDPALFDLSPVLFESDSTELSQEVIIPEIASPWNIEAIYLWGGGTINRRVYVPYERRGQRTIDDGWELTITISEDQSVVRDNIDGSIAIGTIDPGTPIFLTSMGLQIRVLDENWDPPNGVFDLDVLSTPGSFSNVVNGYGFWGSVGLYIQEWNVCHLSEFLGYEPDGDGC